MSKGIRNFVVCVLMVTKPSFAVPLQSDNIELPEFNIADPETSETAIDDTIDIFSINKKLDGTEKALPLCDSNDCEVELNAEELGFNDFNTDFTSQEDIPTETENEIVEEPTERTQIDLESERKSKNEEILSKIESAILKSRSHDDDCNDIVKPIPEFVPIFKPCKTQNNVKIESTIPETECTKSPNPKGNEDKKFVITGLYLKPLTDVNPNTNNCVSKGPTPNAIPTTYIFPSDTRTANVNLNTNIPCGFPSINQNQISPNNLRLDIVPSFPSSNSKVVLGIPTQKQIITLNQNQGTVNMQTEPFNTLPCSQCNPLNTPNQMSSRNVNLCTVDPVFANPNILLNSNIPYKTNINAVVSEQATPCTDNLQLLNSNAIAANTICSNNVKAVNTNLNIGEQIQNQLIVSKSINSRNVLPNTLSVRNKPIVLFRPETFTRHEVCGDFLKKRTYTVLVPFHTSKIV